MDPFFYFSTDAPIEISGGGYGSEALLWKRFVSGCDLVGNWDSFEWASLAPGGSIGEHMHDHTEEIYFVTKGRAVLTLDGEDHVVQPGDLIATTIGGRHGTRTIDGQGLEFIVAEVLPPVSLDRSLPWAPSENKSKVVSIGLSGMVDASACFDGDWDSISVETIQPGESRKYISEGREHAVYILDGSGDAHTASRDVGLRSGVGFALPLGGAAEIVPSKPLTVLDVTVRVP